MGRGEKYKREQPGENRNESARGTLGREKKKREAARGAIHWTKISGNSGTKSNGTEHF